MGRSLSPILKRELENLDKDAESRQAAMTALRSFVKDLDSKAIPLFLAEVSRNKEAGSLSGECTISLYEVLARVHGIKIVPLIDNIMGSIVKTLASSAGSFSLQQACSKVVPAIARYGIDASVPEEKKRHIIHSLCNPLLDSLLGSQESLTSGVALCLKALVENDNWRFASFEMVNKVCQNVAGALEESSTQSNAHMGLVMSLAKRNAVALEPYARLLIQAGLQILNGGTERGNSQKRLSAIQMINFLMKCLDSWSIFSEIESIIEEMENCQCDPMAYVKGAALEALQTARRIAAEKGPKLEKGPSSVTESNISRGDLSRRFFSCSGYQSPASASPMSHTLNSFVEYDSLIGSPILTTQDIQYLDSDCKSMDGKLWSYENRGVVDVSLKDGLFSEIARSSGVSDTFSEQCGSNKFVQNNGSHEEEFFGFSRIKPRRRMSRSATSTPIRSRTPTRACDFAFSTPRNLIKSLHDASILNSGSSRKPARRSRDHFLNDYEWSPVSRCDRNCTSPDGCDCGENESLYADVEQFQGSNESVSSTEDIPAVADLQLPQKAIPERKTVRQKVALKLVLGLSFALLAVVTPAVWLGNQGEVHYLVPT